MTRPVIVPKNGNWQYAFAGSQPYTDLPLSFLMQANWKPHLHSTADKSGCQMGILVPVGEKPGVGGFCLATLCWSRGTSNWECLCPQTEMFICFVWSLGICECWVLSSPRARWLGSQSLKSSCKSWCTKYVDKLLPGRSWRLVFIVRSIQKKNVELPTSSFGVLGWPS